MEKEGYLVVPETHTSFAKWMFLNVQCLMFGSPFEWRLLWQLVTRKKILLEFSHPPDTSAIIFVIQFKLVQREESKAKITARIKTLNRHKLLSHSFHWHWHFRARTQTSANNTKQALCYFSAWITGRSSPWGSPAQKTPQTHYTEQSAVGPASPTDPHHCHGSCSTMPRWWELLGARQCVLCCCRWVLSAWVLLQCRSTVHPAAPHLPALI